jgi:radical SAM superfamily enzyme YgiQ (UPF0313 family)
VKWSHVERARRILAREQGAIVKDWGGRLPIALVYPNTYAIGMSSLGLQAVYRLFNAQTDVACERAFWQPRLAAGEPILTVESQRPIAGASVIAFSVSYEMDYLNLVQVLRQAKIPLRADERDAGWPAVIVGGPAVSANPLPIADFVDAAIVGEAEELIEPLVSALWDGLDGPRDALWQVLSRVPGAYAPHLSPGDPRPVRRQWLRDIDAYPTQTVVHTPDTEFGDMHLIEIARGCGRGCRFCLTGFACRPKRERSVDSILAQAREGLAFRDRLGLVGAAVSDYGAIDTLVARLRDLGARLSVSSLRVDPLSEPLLQALAESKARTLTMAPEAGSERLRQVINKGVTESDLLYAAERAAYHRFRQLKLYFMIGLPTETDGDIEAIAALCEAVAGRFPGRVTANVTPFVPKAHTPFQWAAMTPATVLDARVKALQKRLRRQGIDVRGESPQWATIQGILARGDRRLSEVLLSVEGTSLGAWRRAFRACDVDADAYVRARTPDESLPWAFIQTGVRTDYLRREHERASDDAPTPTVPCPPQGCRQCGACED